VDLLDKDLWDDSALVRSWNDALIEYKKYHSIQARGENVEDVLKNSELKQLKEERYFQRTGNSVAPMTDGATGTVYQNVTVGTERDAFHQPAQEAVVGDASQTSTEQRGVRQKDDKGATPLVADPLTVAAASSMPQAILGSGQDDPLKNLMMSWYYAGYYQGIYEGQK
ncbi:hypothetical protein K490DRAFT_23504, partial [Saccharata proteae CBS 121410]